MDLEMLKHPGTWTGDDPMTFTYQWQRCDANGGNCASIAGATNRTYVVTAADVNRSVRVIVTARNPGGSRAAWTTVELDTGHERGGDQAPGGCRPRGDDRQIPATRTPQQDQGGAQDAGVFGFHGISLFGTP